MRVTCFRKHGEGAQVRQLAVDPGERGPSCFGCSGLVKATTRVLYKCLVSAVQVTMGQKLNPNRLAQAQTRLLWKLASLVA